MNIQEIKIVKLKTGEDIIGSITDIDETRFSIKNPMLIDIMEDSKSMQQSYVIKSWLPHQLYKLNEVSLWIDDTLFMSEATNNITEYYHMMVEKIDRYIASEELMDKFKDDELIELLLELNEASIH